MSDSTHYAAIMNLRPGQSIEWEMTDGRPFSRREARSAARDATKHRQEAGLPGKIIMGHGRSFTIKCVACR